MSSKLLAIALMALLMPAAGWAQVVMPATAGGGAGGGSVYLTDSGGNPVTVTGNKLDVNASVTATAPADTVGSTVSLGALNNAASVAVAGQNGAEVCVAVGTLAATLTPEVSSDGGSTYVSAILIDSLTGALASTLVLTNPNALTCKTFGYIGSIDHVRIRVSSYTSGAASATVRAVWTRPFSVIYGSDGTNLQPIFTSSGGVIKVDASATTQPISGTVAVTQGTGSNLHTVIDSGTITAVTAISNALPAGTNVIGHVINDASSAVIGHVIADSGSTTVVTGSVTVAQGTASSLKAQVTGAGSAGTADAGVVTVQGIASMTPIQVQSNSANLSTATNQTGGSQKSQIVDGSGNVISATTNALDINIKSGSIANTAFTANAGTNLNTSTLALETGGNLATIAGAITSAKIQANVAQFGGVAVVADPCQTQAGVSFSTSISTSTTVVTGTSAKKIYICDYSLFVGGTATNVAVVEGTGTLCATGLAVGPSGGTTAAAGWNFLANQGTNLGAGGYSVWGESTNADNICILLSAANQVNFSMKYVVQ